MCVYMKYTHIIQGYILSMLLLIVYCIVNKTGINFPQAFKGERPTGKPQAGRVATKTKSPPERLVTPARASGQ